MEYKAVTFDSTGGSSVATELAAPNGSATKPSTDPTRTGYLFQGWFTAASGGDPFDFTAPITAATTAYAHWVLPAVSQADEPGLAKTGSDVVVAGEAGAGILLLGLLALIGAAWRRRRGLTE